MLARSGHHRAGGPGADREGPRRRSRRDRGRHIPRQGGRRGHSHGHRAASDRGHRAGRREVAYRTLAKRSGCHRRGHGGARAQPRGTLTASGSDGHAGRAGRAPSRLAAARLHTPPARPAGVSLSSPAGLVLEVPARPPALQLLHDRHGRPAAGRRRAGRRELRHRPHVRGSGAGLQRHRRELAGRGVKSRLRARLPERGGHLRRPPVTAGLGDRALVDGRIRLLPGGRRLCLRLEPHAAEEEPRRGRATARQGASHRGPAGGSARGAACACR